MDERAEQVETRLVRQAQQGDADAFGALVDQHQLFVYNLALRTLGSPEDAADATQEAFVRAWLAIRNFRERASFRTWVYRITLNLCFNKAPRIRRQINEMTDDEVLEMPEPYSPAADPEGHLEINERRGLLHGAIDRLPEQYRLLVSLRYQDDLTYEEIASLLNIPVSAVKTGLFRARGRLRQALAVYEELMV